MLHESLNIINKRVVFKKGESSRSFQSLFSLNNNMNGCLHLGIHVDSTMNHGQLFPRDKTTVIAVRSSCILHRCMLYLGPWYNKNEVPNMEQKTQNRIRIIWMFPKIGVSQNGWLIMENPIKMEWMIWGENPPIFGNTHIKLIPNEKLNQSILRKNPGSLPQSGHVTFHQRTGQGSRVQAAAAI